MGISYTHLMMPAGAVHRRRQLQRKLAEYRERRHSGSDDDIQCRVLILEAFLDCGKLLGNGRTYGVSSDQIKAYFEEGEYAGLWNTPAYYDAFWVVNDYIIHGGEHLSGGTGLSEPEPDSLPPAA